MYVGTQKQSVNHLSLIAAYVVVCLKLFLIRMYISYQYKESTEHKCNK